MSDLFLGIDLGTTNSAAALSDGEKVTLVQSAQGGVITPSVVRIDAKGSVVAGQRARRFLEADPENTRAEFKRLMGTGRKLAFASAKLEKSPQELAAAVLKVIRDDVAQQCGVVPMRAVVAVPAMFELPQSAATADAARLAGFEQVEFLQEPVASALAAGWTTDDHAKSWLVYDLGGGTFDVSLVETQEGVLRVVGHDGDNFLGGRDIDSAICEAVIKELEREHSLPLDRKLNATALRKLRVLAEEAKVDAGRGADLSLAAPALFEIGGRSVDVDIVIPQRSFAELVLSIVDRSLVVCERLLTAHGLVPDALARIVLVGGPTLMPLLRDRVAARLQAPLAKGLDPMTLVAQGAAVFAATSGFSLASRSTSAGTEIGNKRDVAPDVWLQHPLVTPDLSPFVVGKLVSESARARVKAVRFARADQCWVGAAELIEEDGTFSAAVSLAPRTATELLLEGFDASGERVPLEPSSIRIRHGVTLSDPPLSRTIGVALADGSVQVFFERGSPLPMRRTFVRVTAEPIAPGGHGAAIRVPIVQGEFHAAHLCRLVGSLEIAGERITKPLPAGSSVELTLSVDRGGGLTASAHVAALAQIFEGVAQLVAPNLTPAALQTLTTALQTRTESLYGDAVVREVPLAMARLVEVDQQLARVHDLAIRAEAGDDDAAEQAARQLSDADGELSRIEVDKAWPELDRDHQSALVYASSELLENGTDTERRALEDTSKAYARARVARDEREAQRQVEMLRRLANSAYLRRPSAWTDQFHSASSRVSEATDVAAAQKLVNQGRAADARNDRTTLRTIVEALWKLLPADAEDRARSHGSGLR